MSEAIEIKLDDKQVLAAVERVRQLGGDLREPFQEFGEYEVDATKKRFAEGKDPDGTPWAPNTSATILEFLRRRSGATSRRPGEKYNNPYLYQKGKRRGRLNQRGVDMVMGKKPLIGESKRLSTEIHYEATSTSLAVGSSQEQAATMYYGAKKGAFGKTKKGAPIPWGDIKPRKFLGLSEKDTQVLFDILGEHYLEAWTG